MAKVPMITSSMAPTVANPAEDPKRRKTAREMGFFFKDRCRSASDVGGHGDVRQGHLGFTSPAVFVEGLFQALHNELSSIGPSLQTDRMKVGIGNLYFSQPSRAHRLFDQPDEIVRTFATLNPMAALTERPQK